MSQTSKTTKTRKNVRQVRQVRQEIQVRQVRQERQVRSVRQVRQVIQVRQVRQVRQVILYFSQEKTDVIESLRDILLQEIMTLEDSEFEGEAIDMDNIAFASEFSYS